jgi:tetratricopeptide repeat protein
MSDPRRGFARIRPLIIVCLFLWSAALPVAAAVLIAEPGGPDQELYNQGRSLIFEERWAEARGVFDTLSKRNPQSPFLDDALYWTAFSLYQENKPEAAYQTLRSLTGRFPDSPWNDDARALMVRCAEAALKAQAADTGGHPARGADTAADYRRFIEESTRDRSAQVSLVAIDTLLNEDPQKAPDLLGRVGASSVGGEGAIVVLDRFFGKDHVKVTFDDASAGFAEGNVHVLVRDGDQALKLTLPEALDAVQGRGARRFEDPIRREMSEHILSAERSLVTQGAVKADGVGAAGRGRTATIVRIVDGEFHYYSNGAETIRIVVLRRSAGFNTDNVQVHVERSDGIRQIALADLTSAAPGPSARGLSTDALHYLTQTLGVIELDLGHAAR